MSYRRVIFFQEKKNSRLCRIVAQAIEMVDGWGGLRQKQLKLGSNFHQELEQSMEALALQAASNAHLNGY